MGATQHVTANQPIEVPCYLVEELPVGTSEDAPFPLHGTGRCAPLVCGDVGVSVCGGVLRESCGVGAYACVCVCMYAFSHTNFHVPARL